MNSHTAKYIRENIKVGARGRLTAEEVEGVLEQVLARAAGVERLGVYAQRAGAFAGIDKASASRAERRKLAREQERAREVERARTEAKALVAALDRAVDKVLAADLLSETQREAILDKIAGIPYAVIPAPTINTAQQWCCRAICKIAPVLSPDELAAVKAAPGKIRRAREVANA